MVDLMSRSFVRTMREDPAEAEVPSHRLLLRAGMIRRVAAGGYAWLPLGLKVLRNVEHVARAGMDRIGAQEMRFPALLPREPYARSGRWDEYGPADRLETAGLRVLVDDRGATAGVKLTDAELLGVPRVVVVGRRVAEGVVEVRERAGGTVTEVRAEDVVAAVMGR